MVYKTMKATLARNANLRERFRIVAASVSRAFGSPWALAVALGLVIVWAATGHYFGYSDGWQLVINTGTTIVTFLMAFLIQATQYRESKALHLKIDELLRAVHGARTAFVNVDDLPDETLHKLATELRQVGEHESIKSVRQLVRSHLSKGKLSSGGRSSSARISHQPNGNGNKVPHAAGHTIAAIYSTTKEQKMGKKRSNENGGHKPSDDVKTTTKGSTARKQQTTVQTPKPAVKPKPQLMG